jgi:hypothetical protein
MKRQWHIRPQVHATADGVRRGDQASHLLLHWSTLNESPPASAPPLSPHRPKEGADEHRRRCPRLDAAPEPGPDS